MRKQQIPLMDTCMWEKAMVSYFNPQIAVEQRKNCLDLVSTYASLIWDAGSGSGQAGVARMTRNCLHGACLSDTCGMKRAVSREHETSGDAASILYTMGASLGDVPRRAPGKTRKREIHPQAYNKCRRLL